MATLASVRDSARSANNLSSRTTKTSVFALAILSMMASFPLFTAGGGINISTLPLSFTFIVKAPSLNTYQAFVSGGSALTPQFQESNFTKLVNDDIENSPFCTSGCSITLNQGAYNETQKIQVTKPLGIFGTAASTIFTQSTFGTPAFNVSAGSFTFNGPRIDDFARRFLTQSCPNMAGASNFKCHVGIAEFGTGCTIFNAQIFNESAPGIFLTKFSSSCSIAFNTIIGIPAQFGNVSQQSAAGISVLGSSQRISNNVVSYFQGSAGITIGNGIINNVFHVFAIANTLFHSEYGVLAFSAVDVHINDNTIFNSTSEGIFVTTGLVGSTFGPLTITGNTISESSQGLCCGSSAGTLPHIFLTTANRCCWYSVSVTGNSMLDRQANMTTAFDIQIGSPNFRNLTITGNALGKTRSTPTISLVVNPPDKSWMISGNPGFNPQPKRTVTITTNPFTYTNNDGYMEQLIVDTVAGGLATITCRGDPLPTPVIGLTTPNLNTLDTCVFTGTTTDTFDVLPT